jgi:hypothetical protein
MLLNAKPQSRQGARAREKGMRLFTLDLFFLLRPSGLATLRSEAIDLLVDKGSADLSSFVILRPPLFA